MSSEIETHDRWFLMRDDSGDGEAAVHSRDDNGLAYNVADWMDEDVARLLLAAPELAAALRALVEHYARFFVGVLGEELHAKMGDPSELAQARRVLAELGE